MDWFLYDNGLRHERVNSRSKKATGLYLIISRLSSKKPAKNDRYFITVIFYHPFATFSQMCFGKIKKVKSTEFNIN